MNKPETMKYKGKHNHMEMQLDAYFYNKRTKKNFKDFKIHKDLITKEKFDSKLLSLLNNIYAETFNIKNGGNKYQKGCKIMYYSYKYLIEDKTGLKNKIYKLIDKITPKKRDVYAYFSNYITNIDENILNNEHKEWVNPWDNRIKSTESFLDLYNESLKEAISLFINTHKFIHNQITEEEYKKILKDKAYTTGLSWRNKKEMKYLEF